MTKLRIYHRTTYRYSEKLEFGLHRLMLRPRESRSLRLTSHKLEVTPAASVNWAQDVFGNALATAAFGEPSDRLEIDSIATLELDVEQWPVFDIAASAASYPFLLNDNDMLDLGALRLQAYLDVRGQLREWAQEFVAESPADTLSLLKNISQAIASRVTYEIRENDEAQTPVCTLNRNRGSCRDLAVLFVDAVRSLGFGARIVSGYLHDPDQCSVGSEGSGSTHAWAEVFVPGAGWIVFDPTNRSVGGFNLIPVAVARTIAQTMPVSGSFIGRPDAFEGMDVLVEVKAV